MDQIKTIARWSNLCEYQIDKIVSEEVTRVVFRNLDHSPYSVIAVFEYANIDDAYESELLNWENLIRCSRETILGRCEKGMGCSGTT